MLELLIAVTILFVGLVPMVQLISSGLTADLKNRSNSVSLIAGQRELEQMMQQIMTVSGGTCSALASQYYFCDAEGQTVGMGQTGTGSTPTQAGCPLDAAKVQLDFSRATTACTAGYFMTKQVPWNQVNGATIAVELRWRVVTVMRSGSPVRKFIILGARLAPPSGLTLITNLQTVVGTR
ncbi:MAG: hypothetical protein ABSB82_24670 [Terriglobia bacterium]